MQVILIENSVDLSSKMNTSLPTNHNQQQHPSKSSRGSLTVESSGKGKMLHNEEVTAQHGEKAENNQGDEEEVLWDDEGDEGQEDRLSLALVGKIWSNRSINPNAFITTMKGIWVTRYGLDINHVGKNTFQFQFFHWKDKEKILAGQPWHFDKFSILFGELENITNLSDIQLFHIPMWVRYYDVPFKGRSNHANARMLGDKIGQFMEMDQSVDVGLEKSMRIRVSVDVREPLKSTVAFKSRGGGSIKVGVKYEKLPMICFHCGRMGHGTRECSEGFGVESPEKRFGPWMKASPWKPASRIKPHLVSKDGDEAVRRKIYFTKSTEEIRRQGEDTVAVNNVAVLLNEVSLTMHQEGQVIEKNSQEKETTKAPSNLTVSSTREEVTTITAPITFNMGLETETNVGKASKPGSRGRGRPSTKSDVPNKSVMQNKDIETGTKKHNNLPGGHGVTTQPKWKRRSRSEIVEPIADGKETNNVEVGAKRDAETLMQDASLFHETDDNPVSKKQAASPMIVDSLVDSQSSSQVAGPTPWTLGDQ